MKTTKKLNLFLAVSLVLICSFVGYQIIYAATGGGTATIAVDGGTAGAGVTVERASSHTFTIALTIDTLGMTLGASSPTFTIPDNFTVPTTHPVATAGGVDADGLWSVTTITGGVVCVVDSSPGAPITSASGRVITVDITSDCADGDKIVLTYKGTSAVTTGATPLVVKTANAGDVSPVTAITAGSPTITVIPASNITINNVKITSPNTVLVTFNNPGSNLAGSPDFSKWHIDVNTGGSSPLNPTSATIASVSTPWTMTLTFAGTPFSDSSISYDSSHGLYVEAIGISDVIGDTNVVLADTSSIAVGDGQVPTITSVVFADDVLTIGETSLVIFTFSEPITGFTNADLTVANGVLSAVTVDGSNSKIYTATFTPTASIDDATNVITMNMTGVTDIIGNVGVGTTDSNNYAIHTTPLVSTTNAAIGGGRRHFGCNDPKALNYEYFSASDPSLCVYSKISTTASPVVTPKLPAAGYPPRETNFLRNILIFFGFK